MPEVEITVDCKFSGQNVDFDYENERTLATFIGDLQEEGMAWSDSDAPKIGEPDDRGIEINGKNFSWEEHRESTLADMGVQNGAYITLRANITQA